MLVLVLVLVPAPDVTLQILGEQESTGPVSNESSTRKGTTTSAAMLSDMEMHRHQGRTEPLCRRQADKGLHALPF